MPPDLRPGRGSTAAHEQTVRIKGADGTKTAPKPGSGSKHIGQKPRQSPRPSNQRVLQPYPPDSRHSSADNRPHSGFRYSDAREPASARRRTSNRSCSPPRLTPWSNRAADCEHSRSRSCSTRARAPASRACAWDRARNSAALSSCRAL